MNLRITRVLVGLSLVVSMTAAELVTSPASAAPPAPADTPTVTLSFTAAPTAADPGTAFTTAPVVAVTGSADPVVLSLVVVSGQASGELKCDALSVAQVASKATFANCKVDHGGLYRLHAALGAASAESAAFLVSGAAWVQFTGQPGGGVGGAVWTSQPLAQVVDGNGAVITTGTSSTAKVGVLIKPGTGGAAATGAALTCTNVNNATLAVAGIATFSGCAINRAATGYQLLAIDVTDKVFGTSNAFDITAGTPAGLAFSTQPIGGAGGSPLTTQPVVAVIDAAGNRVPADTTSVSLQVTPATGTSGAALTCAANQLAASNGAVAFSGCAVDKSGTGYTLTATAAGLSSAISAPFAVSAGGVAGVAFSTNPGGGSGNTPFAVQPVVNVFDAGGNPVAGAVTLSIAAGTGAAGANLTCDANPAVAVAGVATFTGCRIDTLAANYQLVATVGSSTATSTAFGISVAAVATATFTTPPTGGLGGAAFGVQPLVELRDAGGNLAEGSVTLSIAAGFGRPGAALACAPGGNPVSTISGVAHFSGCAIDKIGAGYRLQATVAGSTATGTSASFDVTVGPAAKLAFDPAPTGGTGGTPWAVQPIVAIEDAGGNTVATSDAPIDLVVTTGTGPGALSCTSNSVAATTGVAVFAGCAIDRAAATYTLTATSGALTPATSPPFPVAVGAASQLVFSSQPAGATVGSALAAQPAIAVEDAGGNPVPSAPGALALAITTGSGTAGASLHCASNNSAVGTNGIAAFTGCSVNQVGGGYALTARWSGLSAESAPFGILPSTTPPLESAPTGMPAGQAIGGARYAVNTTVVADDVNTATGALQYGVTDLTVAGVGEPLVIERSYNSSDVTGGAFGRGWSSLLDLSVTFNASRTIATVRGEDGQQVVFTKANGNHWTPPAGARSTLSCNGNQRTCVVTRWDGTSWQVSGTQLDNYLDANGVGIHFVRLSPTTLLAKLTTTDRRRTIDVTITISGSLVTKIKTPTRQVSYGYSGGLLTSVTDVLGNVWAYQYSSSRLALVNDPLGRTRLSVSYAPSGRVATVSATGSAKHTSDTFTYNAGTQQTTRLARTMVNGLLADAAYVDTYSNNVLIRQTFPGGAMTRYSYDNHLGVIALQGPNGFVQTMTYNSAGDVLSQRTPLSSTTSSTVQFSYDGAHHMVSQTDADGNRVVYDYDGPNLESITPPGWGFGSTRLYYDNLGQVATIATPAGRQDFSYDAAGNRTRVIEREWYGAVLNGAGSSTTYDEAGNKTAFTDARGTTRWGAAAAFTTRWDYDKAGNLLKTSTPVAQTSASYDASGDAISATTPTGTSTYAWNESTLTRTTTGPGGATTVQVYDPSGNVITETAPTGGTTTHVYDALGREIVTTDPSGRTVRYTFDIANNAVAIDDGAGVIIRRQFDSLNRLIRSSSNGAATLTTFDPQGNVVAVTDPTGAVVQRTYNSHGNLSSVTDSSGTTSYAYDLADNVVVRADGRGGITSYTYDGMSRLTSMTVGGNTTRYANDEAGQRYKSTDPAGRVTTLTLDGANRIVRTEYTSPTSPKITVAQTFDAQDRRTSMTSAGTTSTYAYDAHGNLVSAGSPGAMFTYDYSHPGSVVETYPDSTVVTYGLDDTGALMSLSSGDGTPAHVAASYIRDAKGRMTGLSLSNGVLQTRSYDSAGNVAAQSIQDLGTVLAGDTYTYDANGNRLSQRTTAAGRSVLNTYRYDSTGRINGFSTVSTVVTAALANHAAVGSPSAQAFAGSVPSPTTFTLDTPQPAGTPTTTPTVPGVSIGYDRVGNITSMAGASYQSGIADQIVAQSGPATAWTYDRSGAVTSSNSSAGNKSYGYDSAGRLSTATVLRNGTRSTVSYTYDGDGNRITRTENGATTKYVWDPISNTPQLALETVGAVTTRRYFHGDGPVAAQTPTDTFFFHLDPLGTTDQVTNGHGDIVAAYTYNAFGVVTATGPQTGAVDLLFQGQLLDATTGLYDMGARNYDPTTGRFTQREPMETAVGEPVVAAYAFVRNRPTYLTDPTGTTPTPTVQSVFRGQSTEESNDVFDAKLGVLALGVSIKAGVKIASSFSEEFKDSTKAANLKFVGKALAVVGIALSAYVTIDNCMNGTLQKCIGSAVGLAVNVAFTVGCSFVTSGIAAPLCGIVGAILSAGLEFVISTYGPDIVNGIVDISEQAYAALAPVATAIADYAVSVANDIADSTTRAIGVLTSGFNDATEAISSGFQSAIDTLNEAGYTAAQMATVLANTFKEGADQAVAGLISLGYDIKGAAEALANVFQQTATQAAQVLKDTFTTAASVVATALSDAYATSAAAVTKVLADVGYAVDEVADALQTAYAQTGAAIAGFLQNAGYVVDQIAGALQDVLDLFDNAAATVLKTLNYTVQQIAGALLDLYHLTDQAAAAALKFAQFAVAQIADALQDVYNDAAAAAASALKAVGYLADQIATGLSSAYTATAAAVTQILKDLSFTATQVATALGQVYHQLADGAAALLKSAGYLVDQVGTALQSAFAELDQAMAQTLKDIGYAATEVATALKSVFNTIDSAAASILQSINYGVADIASALQSAYNDVAATAASILKGLNFAIDQIAGVLQNVFGQAAAAVAQLFKNLGYSIAQIGDVLLGVFGEAAAAAAQVLQAIGAVASEIATVLSTTFGQAADAIGGLLSSIGFNSDTIAAIGGAFSDFGNDVADFFSGLF
ncbi:MAG: sle [Ilumatobacteraceae bacterium]|nr:sle [Ilumatobacteraceae bacterium]